MISLVEKYRPKTLTDFVGLDRPRAIFGKLAQQPYPSAWLLLGPSGLGKTTMALTLAEQIGGSVHHIPSRSCNLQTVEDVIHHCHYAPFTGEWNFVLVDEADQMSAPAQLAFLSKLDTTAAPPKTIFFFTANATNKLEDRFVSRCRTVRFTTEGILDPAAALLKKVWAAEGGRGEPDFCAMLRSAGFNVRQALMDMELRLIAGPEESAQQQSAPRCDPRLPPAGTVLVREFQRRQVKVQVLADGFQFQGRRYTSLSAIAREVTQGNRNGYTFFRLGAAAS